MGRPLGGRTPRQLPPGSPSALAVPWGALLSMHPTVLPSKAAPCCVGGQTGNSPGRHRLGEALAASGRQEALTCGLREIPRKLSMSSLSPGQSVPPGRRPGRPGSRGGHRCRSTLRMGLALSATRVALHQKCSRTTSLAWTKSTPPAPAPHPLLGTPASCSTQQNRPGQPPLTSAQAQAQPHPWSSVCGALPSPNLPGDPATGRRAPFCLSPILGPLAAPQHSSHPGNLQDSGQGPCHILLQCPRGATIVSIHGPVTPRLPQVLWCQ